jgi:hypothetical protein
MARPGSPEAAFSSFKAHGHRSGGGRPCIIFPWRWIVAAGSRAHQRGPQGGLGPRGQLIQMLYGLAEGL